MGHAQVIRADPSGITLIVETIPELLIAQVAPSVAHDSLPHHVIHPLDCFISTLVLLYLLRLLYYLWFLLFTLGFLSLMFVFAEITELLWRKYGDPSPRYLELGSLDRFLNLVKPG